MVSIIMPIYNGQKTMVKAIDSVLNQSYQNIQVILIDDGSTDQSLQVIEKYAQSDSRIEYVAQSNKGQAAARNIGLKYAKGEFILFVDCDDFLEITAVQELVSYIEITPKASFVLFGFNIYLGESLIRTPNPGNGYYTLGDGYLKFLPIKKLMASPCNKLYRREYIKNVFDESLIFGEDGIFNYSNFKKDTEIALCSKCLYKVQLGTENSVNKRYKKGKLINMLQGRNLEEKVCSELFKDQFDKNAFRINELATTSFIIYTCCTKLNMKEAIQELKKTMEQSEYLSLILDKIQLARIQDKFLLIPFKRQRYLTVIFRSKILYLFRKYKKSKRI